MKLLADSKSHFSIGESILTPDEIAQYAAEAGYDAAALCDTMTISGFPDFTKACDKHGIKPILGVRLRICDTLDRVDKQYRLFPKLYILTDEGFRIVTRLLSIAYDDDHFYRTARLTWQDVLDALDSAEGHLAYSTGTLYSASRDENALDMLKEISARLRASHALPELSPGMSAVWDRQALECYRLAEALDTDILLSRPVLYHKINGADTLGLMQSVVNNHKRDYSHSFSPVLSDYRVPHHAQLVRDAVSQVKSVKARDASVNVDRIKTYKTAWSRLIEDCHFKLHKMDVTLPKMAPDEDAELWRLAKEGLKMRISAPVFGYMPDKSLWPKYAERLKYEMDVLTKMGFAGYFLLTREIVNWSKENGILVGPGRGSVGGSLVAYVLGITDVDPLRFGLIFERFINPERIDLPDADLDFMSTRRHEVIEHIKDTYGRDKVAGISNYSTLGSRAAVSDLSRIVGVEAGRAITKHIPVEQGTAISLARAREEVSEVEKFATENAPLWNTACDIEGRIRTLSVHAAGIIVAGEPLVNRAVVEIRKGESVVGWDKRVVEDMGLVKMDILGLSTLDLIGIALSKIKTRHGKDVNLAEIPIDDEKVLKEFGRGNTVGVFQFESGGMRRLLKDIHKGGGSISFDEISAATALYRPGPMESGLMEDFVEIKSGYATESYEHPSMQNALEETYSVIVYQEQVMRIAQDLCGFTMAEADKLRKAIGKKDATLMATMSEKFVEGATAGYVEVELDDGTMKRVHRKMKFMCDDGVKRTVEEAEKDGVEINI